MLFEYKVQINEKETTYIFNGVHFCKEQIDCIVSFLKEHTSDIEKQIENDSDKPTMTTDQYGTKRWYLNGQLHRTDGPAIEYANGTKSWYLNGKLHRTDGPAIECADGEKLWYLNGKLHRTDGPAVEYANGGKLWYLDGYQLSKSDHCKRSS